MGFTSNEVRRFLSEAFSDEEFETFCFDSFSEVQSDFSAGMSKRDKIQRLIEYCQLRDGVEALFKALQSARPEQYAARFSGLPAPKQFEAAFTPGDGHSNTDISITRLAEITDQSIATQTETIRFYRSIALGLIGAGVVVIVAVIAPLGWPISAGMRPMVGVGGAFICSLSTIQFHAITKKKYELGVAKTLRRHLDDLHNQPVVDASTRAQLQQWLNVAYMPVLKAKTS